MVRSILFLLWDFLNENLTATLIGTFIGVYLAFWINSTQEDRKRENIYGILANQIAFEWMANAQYAKEILTSIDAGHATVRRFNLGIVESALQQTYLFEFAPSEFIQKLRIYRENLLIVNKQMDYNFSLQKIVPENLNRLKVDIQKAVDFIDELGKVPMR